MGGVARLNEILTPLWALFNENTVGEGSSTESSLLAPVNLQLAGNTCSSMLPGLRGSFGFEVYGSRFVPSHDDLSAFIVRMSPLFELPSSRRRLPVVWVSAFF